MSARASALLRLAGALDKAQLGWLLRARCRQLIRFLGIKRGIGAPRLRALGAHLLKPFLAH
jgi:hypothetical protein